MDKKTKAPPGGSLSRARVPAARLEQAPQAAHLAFLQITKGTSIYFEDGGAAIQISKTRNYENIVLLKIVRDNWINA